MAAAITILSLDDRCSRAALVGDCSWESAAFLEQHLDELVGSVMLECEHLLRLDEDCAMVLLDFRRRRAADGHAVMFRRLTNELRGLLLTTAATQTAFPPASRWEASSCQPQTYEPEAHMGENIDEAKGRMKEAAGDLTDDQRLKKEGKLDRAGASVKEKAGDAADKVEDAVDTVKDKLKSNG